jgi:hypothetical protein
MNVGLRALLLIAAVVCFIIAIFSDVHWPDWMAIGLACTVGSFLVADMGWDRPLGTRTRTRT